LDDLLDDIEIEHEGESDIGRESKIPQCQDWINATEHIREDVLNRWSSYMLKDMNTKMDFSLQCSEIYRSWDGQPPTHQSVGKILQDAVRGACLKCGFEERKATALLSLTYVLEPGPGKALQAAYSKQILKDVKRVCKNDPNLDETIFPSLASHINE
jgi:hypothetical protein